ncbi:hypothetical protein [Rhodoblastus sp.]|uniref:hypothetical protein n=1 Tax=Rhodoblastus sp. TaxID=1962975 RepID=UPI003F959604
MVRSQQGAFSGQGAARNTPGSGDELRMLAGVLNDIMPVLDRIQARSPQAAAPGFYGQMPVETLAAVAFVSDLGADSLRRLTAYLEANATKFEGLDNCAPIVAAAARALAARDYAQGFTLLFEVYRAIAILRGDDPELPAPGSIANLSAESRRGEETQATDDKRDGRRPAH